MALGVAQGPIDPQAENLSNPLQVDRGIDIRPRWFCYVFNVSAYPQQAERGPRNFRLPGKRPGERYRIGAVIPSTVVDSWIDTEGNRRFMYNDGEEVARDVVNPGDSYADNNDLSKWGIGYFRRDAADQHPEPTEEELRAVEQSYEENMRVWLEDADKLAAGGQLALINPVHLRAAQHFGVERSWNQQIKHPTTCPGCGENVKPGIARHMPVANCGYIFDREKAWEHGMLTTEEARRFGFVKDESEETAKPAPKAKKS